MRVLSTQAATRAAVRTARTAGARVGLVPTMGALHEGHLSLVARARAECDEVVMSIFVNPLQFGPGEDYRSYPRDLQRDLRLAEAAGVDVAFVPPVDEMYPRAPATTVSAGRLATILEGEHRPGHFDGVCTVVVKLFNVVEPDAAYFGQKDAQQAAVIARMTEDLSFGIDIVVCPIVREPDGVAMSSRNAYLSAEERVSAGALYRALLTGRDGALAGAGVADIERAMRAELEAAAGVQADYARALDLDTFADPGDGDLLLLVAARVGRTRLIDNLTVRR